VFWFGRYIERAEDMARAISAHERLCLDMPWERSPGWLPLLTLCGEDTTASPRAGASEQEIVLELLITDTKQRGSVLSILTQAREDLRLSRPIVPKETWQTLNAAYLLLREVSRDPSLVKLTAVLPEVIAACQQVTAQITASMTHDDAYRFVRLGRYLERADMLLRVTTLASAFDQRALVRPFDDVLWMGLLRAIGAYQMYRRNNHGRVDADRAFAFLLTEARFPRSLNHCVAQVERELGSLPHGLELQEKCRRCKAEALPKSDQSAMVYVEQRLAAVSELSAAVESAYFG
jgi:uncharacterized alpha-E superfamily protein